MNFLHFVRKLRQQWFSVRDGRRGQRRQPRKTKLEIEFLESRINPVGTNTWTAGGAVNNWNVSGNWSLGRPPQAGDDLVFPAGLLATDLNTTNNIPGLSLNSITIAGSNYTLGGQEITLGGPAEANTLIVNSSAQDNVISFNIQMGGTANRQFFVVNAAAEVTLSGLIKDQTTGPVGIELTKQGNGILTLTRDNATTNGFTGAITVSQGILQIQNRLSLGTTAGATTVQTNAELQLVNVTGIIDEQLLLNGTGTTDTGALLHASGTTTWAGNIRLDSDSSIGANAGVLTISGQISDEGAGQDLTKEGFGQIIFAHIGGNTYRGLTTIDNGILTIRDPLSLGPASGTPESGVLVNSSITQGSATLQLDFVGLSSANPDAILRDPTQPFHPTNNPVVGFLIRNELLTLNGAGFTGMGALNNLHGNNIWSANVTLGSLLPDGRDVSIGVELDGTTRTELTFSGVVQDPNGTFNLTKIRQGTLIFNNANTYGGSTTVQAGILNIRDSQALGDFGSSINGTTVITGAALQLEVDTGFDAFGRDLSEDSTTGQTGNGPQLGLRIFETLNLNGLGIGNLGALHSITGINRWIAPVNLGSADSSIGVDRDPNASNTNIYFTNDYSLTIGDPLLPAATFISGNATFHKEGAGHLILPNSNTYTGDTIIEEGWITVQDNRSLGSFIPGGDTIQPNTTVNAGAALHLKSRVPGANFNLIENLVLSGTGIVDHPFGLINQKGALMSLGGINTIGGPAPDGFGGIRSSDIALTGNAGIGVELLGPDTVSELTITSSISDFTAGANGGITKLGSKRLNLQGDGSYTGAVFINEGVLRVQHDTALGTATSGTFTGTQTYTTTNTTIGTGIRELQKLTVTGAPESFTLTFNGATTAPLPFNATPLQVQNALNALSTIGGLTPTPGSVTVNQAGNVYTITFQGVFQGVNQTQLIATGINGTIVVPETLMNGDGTALELTGGVASNNGGVSAGLGIWNEHLILKGTGNNEFGADPLTVLSNDNLWRGPVTLSTDIVVQINPSTRINLFGPINDATNPSPSGSSLTLIGGGQVSLAGENTFRGTAFVDEGVLIVENSKALGSTGVGEIQTVTVTGVAGTFNLTFNGQTTNPLPFDATAAQVEMELNLLSSIVGVGGSVVVSQMGPIYTVTFGGNFLGFDQPLMAAGSAGGTTATVGLLRQGAGGTIVADGTSLQLQGSLTVSGEPLIIEGDGNEDTSNIPLRWFQMGPSPINNGQTPGNQAVTGRVTDVAVDPTDANVIYIATAGGGAWKTKNGGLTWLPLFDVRNGTAEVQTVTVTGGAGEFALTFNGQTTPNMPFDVSAAQVEAALNALSSIGGVFGSVVVTKTGNVFTITFQGNLADSNLPQMTFTAVGGAVVMIATPTEGVLPNGSPEVQNVTFGAMSGTFTLTFNGQTTVSIPFSPQATLAGRIQAALNNLPTIGGVNAFVNVIPDAANLNFSVVFLGTLAGANVPQMTGGGSAIPIVSTIANGISFNNFLWGGAIAVSPTDPRVIYFGTGETNNSGLFTNNAPFPATNPSDSFYGTGVYKSEDSGKTWTLLVDTVPLPGRSSNPLFGLGVSKIAVDPNDSDVIYVATGDQSANPPVNAVPGVYRFDPTPPSGTNQWFNLTAVVSTGRATLNGSLAAPPGTPGPEDDFRLRFEQDNNTWSDIRVVNVDPNNTNGAQRTVLYAAQGKANPGLGEISNAVYRTHNPQAASPVVEPIWYIGDPAVPVNEVQRITVTPWQMGGSYQLRFRGATTPLPGLLASSGAGAISAALNGLSTIGGAGGSVTVVQDASSDVNMLVFNVTFGGALALANQPDIQAIFTVGITVTITTVTQGGGVDTQSAGEFPAGNFPAPQIPLNGNIKFDAFERPPGINLNDVTLYAVVTNPVPNGPQITTTATLRTVVVSNTGGRIWAPVTTLPPNDMATQGHYDSTIEVVDAVTVYIGGSQITGANAAQHIFRTTDGGATAWTDFSVDGLGRGPHTSSHAMALDELGRIILGTDGGVWRFNPGPNQWSDINGNLAITQFNGIGAHPSDLNIAFGGSRFNGTDAFTGSQAWTLVDNNDGGQVRVDPKNPNIVYHIKNTNVFQAVAPTLERSFNNGIAGSWTTILSGTVGTRYMPFAIDSVNTARIVVGNGVPNILGGINLQENLNQGNPGSWVNLFAPTNVTAFALATFQGEFNPDTGFNQVPDKGSNTYDPDTIYVTNRTSVNLTKNHGVTWLNRTANLAGLGSIADIVVDPTDRDTVYVVRDTFDALGRKVFRSTNAGQSWTDITNNLPNMPVWKLVVDPRTNSVYIGTESGVWLLPSGSTTWQHFGAGLANVQVKDLELNQQTNSLLAGTYGRSMYQLFLEDGQANAGALRAVSGSSVWTGPIFLVGDAMDNTVTISANGTQALQNGVAAAQLNIVGIISDLDPNDLPNPTLIKIGLGDVILSGSNTYGGVTEVQEGVLVVRNPKALGQNTANTIVFAGTALELESDLELEPVFLNGDGVQPPFNGHNSGALRNVSNFNTYTGPLTLGTDATIGVDSGSGLTIGSKTGLSGVGTIMDDVLGANHNLTKESLGTLVLSSANSYGGMTDIIQGALQVAHANALGTTANGTNVHNGGQLQMQSPVGGPSVVVSGEALTLSGTGIFDTGALLNTGGNTTWDGPVALVAAPGFSPNSAPPGTVGFGVSTAGDTLTIEGIISEALATGITKIGPGILVLAEGNTYSGGTYVTSGVVRIQDDDSLGDTGSNEIQRVTVGGFASGSFTLSFRGAITVPNIPFNATANDVRNALEALSTIGAGDVSVTKTTVTSGIPGGTLSTFNIFTVTFQGTLADQDLPLMTAGEAGGSTAVVSTVQDGQAGTIVSTGAALEIDGDPNGTMNSLLIAPEAVGLNGTGIGDTGALRNISGNNTWQGRVILINEVAPLPTNINIGVEDNTSLAVVDDVKDFVPLLVPIAVPAPSLTKVGNGTLAFLGDNTYSGKTFINDGVLNIRNHEALGNSGPEQQTITVLGAAGTFTLTFKGQTTGALDIQSPTLGQAIQNALNGLSSTGGGVTVSPLGGFPANVYTVTFGGSLALDNQPLLVSSPAPGVTAAITTVRDGPEGTVVASGATLQLQNLASPVTREDLVLNGLGHNGAGALENVGGNNTWSRQITLGSNSSIGVTNAGGILTIDVSIVEASSGLGVTKIGPGTLDYAGGVGTDNTYTGLTQVDQGTLRLNKSGGAVAITGDLTIGDTLPGNATTRWLSSNQVANTSNVRVNSDGLLDLNGQAETINLLNIVDGQATTGTGGDGLLTVGSLQMSGGTLTAATAGGMVILNGNVTATSTANGSATITGIGQLSLGVTTKTFLVNDGPAATDLLINAVIKGTTTEGLTKVGLGLLELDAVNVYTGLTNINAGTVQVDGAIDDANMTGGTLQGTGTVGDVTATGGTVAPGDSAPGILNTGNVTWNGSTTFNVELNGLLPGNLATNHDQLLVTGDVTLGGANLTGNVNHPTFIPPVGTSFTIMQTVGGTISGQFAQGSTVFLGGMKFSITYTGTTVVLTRIKANANTVMTLADVKLNVATQDVTIMATVSGEAMATFGTPSGTVEFFDNGVSLGTATLVGGIATLIIPASTLPFTFPNPHAVTATYSGDSDFNGSSSSPPLFFGDQRVVSVSPASPLLTSVGNPTPLQTITLTFLRGVAATTLDNTTVKLTSPTGVNIPIAAFNVQNPGVDTIWQLDFVDQGTPGVYTVTVDETVADFACFPMDQDMDGIGGENTQDEFIAKPVIDGLAVTGLLPNTEVLSTEGLSSLTLTFNMEVDASSFNLADIVLRDPFGVVIPLSNPSSTLTPVLGSNNKQWLLTFPTQNQPGQYTVTVGQNIRDTASNQTLQPLGNLMNQNKNGIFGELGVSPAGDQFQGTITVAGLKILSITPTSDSVILTTLSTATITFNMAVQPSSFSVDDFVLTKPDGSVVSLNSGNATLTSANPGIDTIWILTFPPQNDAGVYKLTVGPNIANTAGFNLDQNTNGIPGENGINPVGDQVEAKFVIDGLRVLTLGPTAPVSGAAGLSSVTLTFNMAVDPATFGLADIDVKDPTGTTIVLSNPTATLTNTNPGTDTIWLLTFPTQHRPGGYTVTVGPDVRDRAGNPMNQNGNLVLGQAGVSPVGDQFSGIVRVSGMQVTAITPDNPISDSIGLSFIDITFSIPVAPGSFSLADLTLVAPGGINVPLVNPASNLVSLNPGINTIWRVSFPSQNLLGNYILTVGPDITDADGFGMDQNQNGVLSQIGIAPVGDQARDTITVEGLYVKSTNPSTLLTDPGLSSIIVTFSEGVNGNSLVGQVSLASPSGTVLATGFTDLTIGNTNLHDVWQFTFPTQTAEGQYTLTISDDVLSLVGAGRKMDQNHNALPGEGVADQYQENYRVSLTPPEILRGPISPDLISYLISKPAKLTARRLKTLRKQFSIPRGVKPGNNMFVQTVRLFNNSTKRIQGPLALFLDGLPRGTKLANRNGTIGRSPFVLGLVNNQVLESFTGETFVLIFRRSGNTRGGLRYSLRLIGGFGLS